METNIKYIAVGRQNDQTLIATHGADRTLKDAPRQQIQSLLTHRSEGDWQSKLDSFHGTWTLIQRNQISYMLLTHKKYPQRFSGAFLNELVQTFEQQGVDVLQKCGSDAFTRVLSAQISSLASKYQDLNSLDRIHGVNAQVLQVQNLANSSIQQVLRNTEQAVDLQGKTDSMAMNAEMFYQDSKKLERLMYLRKWKINCILICVGLCILLYIVVPIIVTASEDQQVILDKV